MASLDYVTVCTECKSGLIAAISTLIMVWAVALVIVSKRLNLSLKERQVLRTHLLSLRRRGIFVIRDIFTPGNSTHLLSQN